MKYTGTVTISGYFLFEVEATNEAEAEEKLKERYYNLEDMADLKVTDMFTQDIQEENQP